MDNCSDSDSLYYRIDSVYSCSQEFTKDKFMDMAPEYDLETRQEVQEGIEKFRAELKAAKEQIALTNGTNSQGTAVKERTKILVAVATKGGGLVNQHFGHAKEFQVYEVDGSEVKYVAHRRVDHFCQGGYGEKATLDNIINAISDCKAVLVSKIGESPKEKLNTAGIEVVESYDVIEKVALDYYQEFTAH
ncbi:nitrogenase cofactor biosynthesis protein NifB [Calothrix sp. NIES-4101]|nr:nitrogenase cofactor biosynthesis protein NifB [Calothrix sp. NIES-4101]